MTARIIPMQVVRKRGRKVTKGPCASIVTIYEAPPVKEAPRRRGHSYDLSVETENMAVLLADRAERYEKKKIEYAAWIDASPTVERFPDSARYRSEDAIERLKSGLPEHPDEDEEDPCPLATKIAERAKQIMAERGLAAD